MSGIKALGLAALATLAPQLARAADLLPPAPPVVAPLRGAIVEDPEMSGWYIRGDLGVNIYEGSYSSSFTLTNALGNTLNTTNITSAQGSIGDSAFIRAGVGYQFNNWFRADVTGEYHTSAPFRRIETYGLAGGCPVGVTFCQDAYSADLSAAAFLVNGYFDLGTWNGLTPYVGAGVGFAHLMMQGLTDISAGQPGTAAGWAPNSSQNNFAWAGMAGVTWNVNKRLKLEMGYRYMNMGTVTSAPIVCTDTTQCFFERQKIKLSEHDLHLGMRWMLGDFGASDSYSYSEHSLPSAVSYSSGAAVGGGYVAGGGGYVAGGAVQAGGGAYAAGPTVAAHGHY